MPFQKFGMKLVFLKERVNPVPLFPGPTPLDGILRTTPIVGTLWFFHARAHHFQSLLRALRGRILGPPRWHGVVGFQFVILFVPPVLGVVVNKDGTVPTAIQFAGTTVETLGAFVE